MIIQTPLEGLDSSLDELISNPDYCLQEKKNGNRVLVKKAGHLVVGFNRLGGVTGVPAVIENVMIFLEDDFIVDGEIVGDHYYIFDIISLNNEIVSSLTFVDRQKLITNLLYGKSSVLSSVSQLGCDYAETSKQSSLEFYRKKWNQNKDKVDFDGVVFKDIHGEYLRGKSNLCIKYNFKKKEKVYCYINKRRKDLFWRINFSKPRQLVSSGNWRGKQRRQFRTINLTCWRHH